MLENRLFVIVLGGRATNRLLYNCIIRNNIANKVYMERNNLFYTTLARYCILGHFLKQVYLVSHVIFCISSQNLVCFLLVFTNYCGRCSRGPGQCCSDFQTYQTNKKSGFHSGPGSCHFLVDLCLQERGSRPSVYSVESAVIVFCNSSRRPKPY